MSTTVQQQAAVPTGTWTLDPTHSTIGFSILYMGVAPFAATFREVEATLDESGLRGEAVATSIDAGDPNLAGHLASPEFFDAENHPTIRIETGPGRLEGESLVFDATLTVKGNEAPLRLEGSRTEPTQDPWGNTKLGLTLRGRVDRHALGLDWNAPLPGGGSMLADQVDLSATLVFVRAEAE